MAIRIGSVELTMLQKAATIETRQLIQHIIPGKEGSSIQDLGRKAARLELEGILTGEGALQSLEQLRSAYTNAQSMPFSSDIAVGSDIVDVIIEDLQARQLAGYESRFWFYLIVREYSAPVTNPATALNSVNKGIAGDAALWNTNNLNILGVMEDPSQLTDMLTGDSSLLEQIDMNDLAGSVTKNLNKMGGQKLAGVMKVISSIDFQKSVEFVMAIKDGKSMGEVLGCLADAAAPALSELVNLEGIKKLGLDSDLLESIVTLVTDGDKVMDLLQKIFALAQSGESLVASVVHFDFNAITDNITFENFSVPPGVTELFEKVTKFFENLAAVVTSEFITGLLSDILSRLGSAADTILGILSRIQQKLEEAYAKIQPVIADVSGVEMLYRVIEPLKNGLFGSITELTEGIEQVTGQQIPAGDTLETVLSTVSSYMDKAFDVMGYLQVCDEGFTAVLKGLKEAVENLGDFKRKTVGESASLQLTGSTGGTA